MNATAPARVAGIPFMLASLAALAALTVRVGSFLLETPVAPPAVAEEVVCSGEEDGCSGDEDAGPVLVELLQMNLQISHQANIEMMPGSLKAMNRTAALGVVHDTCNTWPFEGAEPTPLSLQSQIAALQSLGYLKQRRFCEAPPPNVHYMLKTPGDRAKLTSTGKKNKSWFQRIPVALWACGVYLLIMLVLMGRMLWMITRPNSVTQPKSFNFRPEAESWKQGMLSWLCISWATPWICRYGNSYDPATTKIKPNDLGLPGFRDYEASACYGEFLKLWEEDIARRGTKCTNLYLVILRFCTWTKVVQLALLSFIFEMMMYLGPTICVNWTLTYMEKYQLLRMADPAAADQVNQFPVVVALVLMFTGMPLAMCVFNTIAFLLSSKLAMRLQAALTAGVYQKAQRMPVTGGAYDLRNQDIEWAPGQKNPDAQNNRYSLAQLVNTDINANLMGFQGTVSKIIIEIPVLACLLAVMFARLGKASFISIGCVFVFTALIFWVVRQMTLRFTWFQMLVGARLSFFQEIMTSIRMIKTSGFEPAATQILSDNRKDEMTQLAWFWFWSGANLVLFFSYPKVVTLSGLAGFTAFRNTLRPSDIFVMMQILGAFKGAAQTMLSLLPQLVTFGPSISRVDRMLKLEEAPLPGRKDENKESTWLSIWPEAPLSDGIHEGACLRIQGTFLYASGEPALRDLNVRVMPGEMVAVMGEVGSGKSTLLSAMLGELKPTEDSRLEIPMRMAYHCQLPVICEATLKENVLYWADLDEKRYSEALHSACLLPDLEILPGGDSVPIGSRGISLSGGQRARVSLARAAYAKNAPVVLVDDPFASVDVPTGKHLLDNLLLGPLMRPRARVVVCQPDRKRYKVFDRILIMSGGRIVVAGTPDEVVHTPEYQALLSSAEASMLQEDLVGLEAEADVNNSEPYERMVNAPGPRTSSLQKFELREEEHQGRADWPCIHFFICLGRYRNLILCFAFFVVFTVLSLFSDLVLVRWSNTMMSMLSLGIPMTNNNVYLAGCATWFFIGTGFFVVHWFFGSRFTLNISGVLHNMILDRLLRAPVDRFYDKTPVGRIMNRMTFDMTDIDQQMYTKFASVFGEFLTFCVPLVYVHIVMPLYLLIGSIPFYYLLWLLILRYWNTMVPLRYLQAVTRSDLNAYITEVEMGCVSGRAYQVAEVLAAKEMEAADQVIKVGFSTMCVTRWVNNRVLLIYSIFCTMVAAIGVLYLARQGSSIGTVGLCLSHITMLIMQSESFLQLMTDAQFQFISMNRLHEYTSLPEERPAMLPTDGKYYSPVAQVHRAVLGSMEVRHEGTRLQIVRPGPTGEMEVILEKMAECEAFQVPAGKTIAWLDPNNPALMYTESWHRIHAVNGIARDAAAMAKELVESDMASVWLSIRSGWLLGGARVVATNLRVGYADHPNDVLHSVNFVIEAQSKTAIAGSTGCGKSTTIQCILRLLEPRGGKIEINGVDIQTLGLLTLRNSMGLVPQDPVLYSGSIRNNMDPFSCYTDTEVWAALHAVQLDNFVKQGGVGLDYYIKADGENISFGQKQLICIARQILRSPELLLLDECTSAIDPRTQELVQNTIRYNFPESTLVAIAHRLETILDFDTVIVFDKGRVVERGSIKELTHAKNGWFAKMLHAKDKL